MRQSTIARNYAEALLELARRAKDLRGWGTLIQSIADALSDQKLRSSRDAARRCRDEKRGAAEGARDRAPRFVRHESVVTTPSAAEPATRRST